ncbi:MAG TPA: histidine phosphatase family protein [Steroidobacteraceae bacterium]|nr:histidine phosphatase family protein [Steroidobacteraceae bacterium]
MKRLTIVRHARADWDNRQYSDFERPLNRRGQQQAREMAQILGPLLHAADLLLTSPAVRAYTTATIFAKELNLPLRRILTDERIYLASATDLLAVIRETGPRIEQLMMFGHNPGITELARQLTGNHDEPELTPAGACTLEFDIAEWSQADVGKGLNARYEQPRRRFLFWR